MRSLVRSFSLLIAIAVIASTAYSQQPPSAVRQVPQDAWILVKVNNLQQASARLAEMGKQFALGMFIRELGDPLASLQKKLNINAGLRKDGDLVVAYFDPDQADGQLDRSFLILIPVTTYREFLGNFNDAKRDGNLDVVKIADEDVPGYMTECNGYACLSPSKALAAKKPGGLQLHGASARALTAGDTDLTLYVNATALSAKYLPQLKNNREKLLEVMDRQFRDGNGLPRFAPVIRALAGQGLTALGDAASDAQAVTFSLGFAKEGLHMTALADFRPDSTIGQAVSRMQNTDAPLLAGLPQRQYLVYGGGAFDGQLAERIFTALFEPAVKQLAGAGEDTKPLLDAFDAMRPAMKSLQGGAGGIVVDAGAQNGMIKVVGITRADPQALMAAQPKMLAATEYFSTLMPGPKQTVTHTPAAKTIDGVKLDKFQTQLKIDPQKPEEVRAEQMMKLMYGLNGPVTYIGALDDKRLIMILGDDDKLAQDAVASARAGASPLEEATSVKAVADKLPQKRLAVAYLAADKMVEAVVAATNMRAGQRVPFKLPPDTPPIGAAVSADASALRVDVHISSQLIEGLVQGVIEMQIKMRGGGMGRPGDL